MTAQMSQVLRVLSAKLENHFVDVIENVWLDRCLGSGRCGGGGSSRRGRELFVIALGTILLSQVGKRGHAVKAWPRFLFSQQG